MKKLCKILLLSQVLATPLTAFANSKSVSLLTWWGYFENRSFKKEIENKCNLKLQIQNYRDDIDFIRLFNQKPFDIIIFESTKLPLIKHQLQTKEKADLSQVADKYPIYIKNKLREQTKARNITFFNLSDVLFLYNPKNITLTETDTIFSIIEKLKVKNNKAKLIILDDPTMISRFTKSDLNKQLSVDSFKNLFNYEDIIISNDFRGYKNLGVAIIWSGEAFLQKRNAERQGIDLKVIRIPRYSIITADLIAQVTIDKAATCAAKILTSKPMLKKINSESYYFSPYLEVDGPEQRDITLVKRQFYKQGQQNKWLWDLPSVQELKSITREWKRITLKYGL